jgi:hypothetical protein
VLAVDLDIGNVVLENGGDVDLGKIRHGLLDARWCCVLTRAGWKAVFVGEGGHENQKD